MKRIFLSLALLVLCVSVYSADLNLSVADDTQARGKAVVRFAYLADLHVSEVAANVQDLRNSIADINNMKGVDFVILAGDITEFGSDEEILLAKSVIDELKIPYYIVAGNHDSKWSESGCNTFSAVFGYEHFNFNFKGFQFIGTNSGPNMRMAPALVPRESIVWLDSLTLALPKGVPVIFINHYPLNQEMSNFQTIINLLKRVNIQVSFCGHGHANRLMNFDGIPGVMGRSNLRGNSTPAKPSYSGYNLVTLTSDSLFVAERSNGVTRKAWHKQALKGVGGGALADSYGVDLPCAVEWEFQDDSDIGSAAAFGFNMVFISNTAGFVKALDAADGSVMWSFKSDGKIFSSPEFCEKTGRLVVGSSDGNIYCLDARTGKLKWTVEAASSVLGSPAIYNGVVYIGASDNCFRAIDLLSGRLLWIYPKIRGFIEAKPWADAQGVYIGDWASHLYAFNPATGALLWEWTNKKGRGLSPAAVWPVKSTGKVFVVTPERRTHAIDALTGAELWSARGGRESIGMSPDGSTIYVKTMQDTVFAYSAGPYNKPTAQAAGSQSETGKTAPASVGTPILKWASHAGFGYEIAPSPITTAYDMVFVPTDKGNIYALDAKTGKKLWHQNFSVALINYIRPIGHRNLLITTMDGKVIFAKVR